MRSASLAPIACLNVTSTTSLETGAVHVAFENSTRRGCGRLKAPFIRWPGSLTDSVASPAVEITVAVEAAVYSRATPGVNAPKVAGAPSVSESVAGTVPPTSPAVAVSFGPSAVGDARSPGWQWCGA